MGIKYGMFVEFIIGFIIIAFALFIFVKVPSTVMKKEAVGEIGEIQYYSLKFETY